MNRIITDALSDFLFITEKSAEENLLREGILKEKIYFVGNTMVDTLLRHKEEAEKSKILCRLGLQYSDYAVVTLHRPSNVDDTETFQKIIEALSVVAEEIPIFFPVHPRTMNRIKEFRLEQYFDFSHYPLASIGHRSAVNGHRSAVRRPRSSVPGHIYCLDPLGYLDFLFLMSHAKLVLTDSGGIQEETTVLGIPCITLRQNTERPVTLVQGTNVLAGTIKEDIISHALSKLHDPVEPKKPKFWDGRAGERIIKILSREVHDHK